MNGTFFANSYFYADGKGNHHTYTSCVLHLTEELADKAWQDEWASLKDSDDKLIKRNVRSMYTAAGEDPEEASRKAWHALGNDYCEAMEELKKTTRQ